MTVASSDNSRSRAFDWRWNILTLSQQFVIMGGLVIMIGMLIIGFWVSRQIEEGVTRNAGTATALYVDGFISPLTRELENADVLSIGPIRALDEVFKDSPVGSRLISVKIWKPNGLIVYSSNYDLIGRKFEPTDELARAAKGEVSSGFDDLDDEEDARERASGLPILEIYSPIRAPWSGKVIAVAEFYEDATQLKATLASARLQSWMFVGAIMAAIAGLLMTIVHSGSRTIDRQRRALQAQLEEVTNTSEQNRKLRDRVQEASERVTELNENFLKRTSAELHDGPAQLLSFAALRLGETGKIVNKNERAAELKVIQTALNDAMLDIRNVCKGLSLPDIDKLTIQEIVERVCNTHMERTGMRLDFSISKFDVDAPKAIKICIYRFVQEALNNIWKHAGDSKARLECEFDAGRDLLSVTVKDDGPGFCLTNGQTEVDGLGLEGLRERVRSIGGELHIDTAPGRGTTLALVVNLPRKATPEGAD